MKASSFANVLLPFLATALLTDSAVGSSAAADDESTQRLLRSVTGVASEDVTSAHEATTIVLNVPRELKKAKGTAAKNPKAPKSTKTSKVPKSTKMPKAPKSGNKEPKSAKGMAPCAAISTQKDALLAIKAGFTNGETALIDWLDNTDPCTWPGILCSGSDVEYISLSVRGLNGTISPLIGCPPLVTSLTTLYFYGNSITGSIPSEIGSLTSLTSLSFGSNNLTGSIPTEIGSLTSLSLLFFNENDLTGTMPAEICALRTSSGGSLGTLAYDSGEVADCL